MSGDMTCSRCGSEMKGEDLVPERTKSGFLSYCRTCYRSRRRAEYARSIDERRAYHRAWQREHPEAAAQWRASNPDAARAKQRRFISAHPEVNRAQVKKHGALKRGATLSDFSASQWEAMKEAFAHRCAYCGEFSANLTQDHVVPLSRGGNHTASNILPACLSCNSTKGTRALDEFIQARQAA